MFSRYLLGLCLAFGVLGLVLGIAVVPGAIWSGRPQQLMGLVGVWVAFGLPTLALLAVVVGPLILIIRHQSGDGLTRGRAALLGAPVAPLSLLLISAVFGEPDETLGGVLSFWARLPMEFVMGALPHAAAGAAFAMWLVPKADDADHLRSTKTER